MKQILVNYTETEEVREQEVVTNHSLSINCGNIRTHKSEYNETMKEFTEELEALIVKYYGN